MIDFETVFQTSIRLKLCCCCVFEGQVINRNDRYVARFRTVFEGKKKEDRNECTIPNYNENFFGPYSNGHQRILEWGLICYFEPNYKSRGKDRAAPVTHMHTKSKKNAVSLANSLQARCTRSC